MIERRDFDVAIVGASVAGCPAARLFAQAGARVA
jgi:flavin-dependent dehydrogenase